MKRFFLFVFCGYCLISCGNHRIHRNLEELYQATILFPDSLEVVISGVSEPASVSAIPVKLLSFYPSRSCTTCTINQLEKWKPVFDSICDSRFLPILLFSPNEHGYRSLIADLKFSEPPYPVYVDKKNQFELSNPYIPEDSRYHTFLLDKNNKVVLVGNPLASDAMWDLFRKTLDNMLAHDGVYVPDK